MQATAEAAMIGGLADWFAVTALFRHPLGIPIPHTAIIVAKKDQFAETLGEFIQDAFLTPEAVTERIRAASVGVRAAAWLRDPDNAARVAAEAIDGAVQVSDLVRDEDVHRVLQGVVRDRLESVPVAPMAGRALDFMIRDGRHQQALSVGIRELDRYLAESGDDLRAQLGTKSPWWLPGAAEDRLFERLMEGAHTLLGAMLVDEGMIATDEGNFVLGKLEGLENKYIFYNDADLLIKNAYGCHTQEQEQYLPEPKEAQLEQRNLGDVCKKVRIYFEADNELFINKGSEANTVAYLTSIFNQMATLYQNDGIVMVLSGTFVWTTVDPYRKTSSSDGLSDFTTFWGNQCNSFNGDLAHLITLDAMGNGGLANLAVLCNRSRA